MKHQSYVPKPTPIDLNFYRDRAKTLSNLVASSQNYKDISDLGVAYLYLGDMDRSIALLENAEELYPGEYTIAANLGTAYELAGRNDKALVWIQEGISRNSNAHFGSEWVHVNVLRAKISMESDSNWLADHTISGLDFGREDIPHYSAKSSSDNCPRDPHIVASHLRYQLDERRQFIPGRDPIVAALMFDLANATAIAFTAEDAIPIFRAALELGYPDRELVDRRITALEILRNKNILSGLRLESLVCVGLSAFVVVVLTIIVTARWRLRNSTATQ